MDNLTHSLTGYMMSRAGLNRWCPKATPILLMAANAPDIDILSLAGGPLLLLDCHRGPTHSLLWAPVVALVPLAVMLLFARRDMNWKRAYIVSLLGVLGHLLIDWTTVYGARLLTPLSDKFYHLDITNIVDLWLLAALLLALAWIGISRLVSSEIGAGTGGGRGVAIAVLLFFCLWDAGRFVLHERAVATLDTRIYSGAPPLRVAALPHFATPLRWKGLVETESAYLLFELNLSNGEFNPSAGQACYKAEPSPAIEAARRTRTFRHFLRFSQYTLWRVTPSGDEPDAVKVEAMDLRFGSPGKERFVATALVSREGKVLSERFDFRPPGARFRLR